jgi:hypothetical protein
MYSQVLDGLAWVEAYLDVYPDASTEELKYLLDEYKLLSSLKVNLEDFLQSMYFSPEK